MSQVWKRATWSSVSPVMPPPSSPWDEPAAATAILDLDLVWNSSDEDWTEEMYREMSRSIFDLFWMGCGQLEP